MIQVFGPDGQNFVNTGEPRNPWRCSNCLTTQQKLRLGKDNVIRLRGKDAEHAIQPDQTCRVCLKKYWVDHV